MDTNEILKAHLEIEVASQAYITHALTALLRKKASHIPRGNVVTQKEHEEWMRKMEEQRSLSQQQITHIVYPGT